MDEKAIILEDGKEIVVVKPPLPSMVRCYPGPWWCPSCSRAFAVTLHLNLGEPCCPDCGGALEAQGTGDDDPEAHDQWHDRSQW